MAPGYAGPSSKNINTFHERISLVVPSRPSDESERVEVTPELLWVLAGEWNRQVIRYFLESDAEEIEIEALATHIAERADHRYPVTPEEVALQLHHGSLPKLAECDLVVYDSEEGVVSPRSDRTLPPDLREHMLAIDDDG